MFIAIDGTPAKAVSSFNRGLLPCDHEVIFQQSEGNPLLEIQHFESVPENLRGQLRHGHHRFVRMFGKPSEKFSRGMGKGIECYFLKNQKSSRLENPCKLPEAFPPVFAIVQIRQIENRIELIVLERQCADVLRGILHSIARTFSAGDGDKLVVSVDRDELFRREILHDEPGTDPGPAAYLERTRNCADIGFFTEEFHLHGFLDVAPQGVVFKQKFEQRLFHDISSRIRHLSVRLTRLSSFNNFTQVYPFIYKNQTGS